MTRFGFFLAVATSLTTAGLAIAPPALAQACTCPSGFQIRADRPPPPLPVYDQPPMPGPGYIWTPGYWSWNNYDYYWTPGTWVLPPRAGLLWTPGYWAFADGVYVYNAGYWARHVGFYGGIVYGFGYLGQGYEGGYWNGDRFFYNRAVNNFGSVNITNVYEKTVVVNNTTINRVSFNGGNGGVAARPTPQEEQAAHEPHVQPTGPQIQHIRAASTNDKLFYSANHGKPAVAATPRPMNFAGEEGAKPGEPANHQPANEAAPTNKAAPGGPAVLPVTPGKPGEPQAKPQTPPPPAEKHAEPTPKVPQAHEQPAAPQAPREQDMHKAPPVMHEAPRQMQQAPHRAQQHAAPPRHQSAPQRPAAHRPAPHRKACKPHEHC